jgi:hypothetical protein
MRQTRLGIAVAAALTLSPVSGPASEVRIGVTVGVPSPPPVVLAPPPVAVLAGTPVHHVPSASFNLFVYDSRYYSFHNETWFVAAGPRRPWAVLAAESVPRPVLELPVRHYKIPPGTGKKMGPAGGWCPPGLATQGRC